MMLLPKYKERRPYDEEDYPGYLEGDEDYLDNNRFLVVALLDAYGEGRVTVTNSVEKDSK